MPVEPQILPFAFPEEVEAEQLVQVSCAVSKGDDPITLQWYKDGLPLVPSANFMINNVASKLSLLLLSSVDAEHSGIYTCLAFNPVGTAEASATLKVKGKCFALVFKMYSTSTSNVDVHAYCTNLHLCILT